MSETHGGNTNWQQDEHGDVMPDYQGVNAPKFPGYERVIPHDAAAPADKVTPQVIDDKFDPRLGLTLPEVRKLNQDAKDKRGGTPVEPYYLN